MLARMGSPCDITRLETKAAEQAPLSPSPVVLEVTLDAGVDAAVPLAPEAPDAGVARPVEASFRLPEGLAQLPARLKLAPST